MFEWMRNKKDETEEDYADRMAMLDRAEAAGLDIKACLDELIYKKNYTYSEVYGALAYAFAEHMAETCSELDARVFAGMIDERLVDMRFPCKDEF